MNHLRLEKDKNKRQHTKDVINLFRLQKKKQMPA